MAKITHSFIQGSDAWHQFRTQHHGASEAAAMLGLSKHVTRSELLRMKATGAERELSEFVQTRILDRGHEVEAKARKMLEDIIGEELFPMTFSNGKLSCSCDGITIIEDVAFECKQYNATLFDSVARGELPEEYQPQCQQIMMVSGAEKVAFVCSDGTPDRFAMTWVLPDHVWFDRIVKGWKQFDEDVANYAHVAEATPVVAAPVEGLPSVSIRVDGALALVSNLDVFGQCLKSFVNGINKEPSDDQGFADAEAAIKTLQNAQDALEAAEASALAQTSSIDEMRRTVGLYVDQARTTRLLLEKIVKSRKDQIRIEIVNETKAKLDVHIAALRERLGNRYTINVTGDFAGVIKGKRTIASLRDAVDTELARCKIAANDIADKMQININTLRELAANHKFLFADAAEIINKHNDDLILLIKNRIAEHDAAETKRLEAERAKIAAEEESKARAKIEAEMRAKEKEENAAQDAINRVKIEQDRRIAAETMAKEIMEARNVNIAAEQVQVKHYVAQTDTPIAAATHPQLIDDGARLRLGEICAALGFTLTAEFLSSLGFKPFATDKNSKLYRASDFGAICEAIVQHIHTVAAYRK